MSTIIYVLLGIILFIIVVNLLIRLSSKKTIKNDFLQQKYKQPENKSNSTMHYGLNNISISDVLISHTINLTGKPKDYVLDYCIDFRIIKETTTKEGNTTIYYALENNYVLGVLLEKNKVFKVIIWLNHKISKGDFENLELFYFTHEKEYYFSCTRDEGFLNKYLIAFESKIY